TVEPGDRVNVDVILDISPGCHSQSHTPTGKNIKLEVTMDAVPGGRCEEPIYPPGEERDYPQLGKLNVYTGQVTIQVPATIGRDAVPGTLEMSGSIRYQICDDKMCFLPKKELFKIPITIVGIAGGN